LVFLPYLAYLGAGVSVAIAGKPRTGLGIVIGGAIFSTLIIVGIFLVALFFGVLADA
jgi:Ca2+/Na+ antiporter